MRIAAIVLLIAAFVEFIRFATYVEAGTTTGATLPEAADAFLPLAGVAAIKVWLTNGWLDAIHPAAAVIVIATLVTALLFRRALCSWLCPLGALSEYLAKLGKSLFGANIRLPKQIDRFLLALKYVGTFALLWWLLSTPTADLVSFMATPFYAVAEMKLFSVYSQIGAIGVLVLLLILALSVFVKSFWCRYLCPYGALQGILGVLSPAAIVKDDANCTGCARCSAVCPNSVDVANATQSVCSAECMGCMNCVSACPRRGVLGLRYLGRPIDPSVFGLAFVTVFLTILFAGVISGHWKSSIQPQEYRQIYGISASTSLPWSTSANTLMPGALTGVEGGAR